MYLVRGLRGVAPTAISSGSVVATPTIVVPARSVRNEALSYGAAKKKTRKTNQVFPLPAWAASSTELTAEEKVEIWKTVQFLGGKDPLQLLALDLIDKIKDTAASRTYYIPESTRNEMFQLWSEDPIVNSDSALAIRYRLSRPRVAAILKLKSREKEQQEKGLLNDTEIDEMFDALATKSLSPASDGKVLDDKLLLRNRISKPRVSPVPAEVNMRVLNKILPAATMNKSWEDQLPKDYKPQPLLHIPSPNKLWKNDDPLKAPVRKGFAPTKDSPGEPSEKTLTRKLGDAFQTTDSNGKVRKATIWEARNLLAVLQPKRRDRYDPTLDASAEPIPDELAVENFKNSLLPDQIHLARFFRSITKTWDVEQREIEAQVDSSLDGLKISTLRPADLMSFDKDQYAYLHHVKRVPNKFTNPEPRGVRSMNPDEKNQAREEGVEFFEPIGPIDDRRSTDSDSTKQRVRLRRNLNQRDGPASPKKKQPRIPKAKQNDEALETEVIAAELRAEDEFKQPYDTSGDVWRAEPVAKPVETIATKQTPKTTEAPKQQQQQQQQQQQKQPKQSQQLNRKSKRDTYVAKPQEKEQKTPKQPQKPNPADIWKQ